MSKVIVGISGGVDSAVAATLLKNSGYEVIAVTFVFTEDFDTNDAVETAKKLNIEHHIIDYKEIFKKEVIDKFINDYNSGITPNPCILCNRNIKLKFLYDAMIKYDADYFATGHYAKIINGKMYKSSDINKDQTYFLSNITKEELNKLLLPLEGISKDNVRKIAEDNNLIVATKKDSTDVCFINSDFKSYIKDKINNDKGKVINIETNEVIGYHDGLNRYTIGQRRGLNIGGTIDRMYVVGKNIKDNILYVAIGDNTDYLVSTSCIVSNVNFFNDEIINECTAKFRYRQEEIPVKIKYLENNLIEVIYKDGIKSVTPGQVCVLYKDDECLGGGIIKEVRKNNEKLWYL